MSFVQGSGNGEWRYDLPKMRWWWNSGRESYRIRAPRRAATSSKRWFLAVRQIAWIKDNSTRHCRGRVTAACRKLLSVPFALFPPQQNWPDH